MRFSVLKVLCKTAVTEKYQPANSLRFEIHEFVTKKFVAHNFTRKRLQQSLFPVIFKKQQKLFCRILPGSYF